MKFFITALIIIAIVVIIVSFGASIMLSILKIRSKRMSRKIARAFYTNISCAYEAHIAARREYHSAKFIQDSDERNSEMEKWKEIYQIAINRLNSTEYLEYLEFLSETEREELNEILSRPRYELM